MPRCPRSCAYVRSPCLPLLTLLAVVGLPGAVAAAFTESAVTFGVASGDSMSYVAGFDDTDGDFDPDFFVTNHWKSEADFYRNEGGATFLEKSGHYSAAADDDRHDQLWADFDNDGDPDQYLIHGAGKFGHDNELFWNLGRGLWREGAGGAGVTDPDGRGREITIADFNGDHWLDIFVVNDLRAGFVRPSVLFWNDGDGTFTRQPNDSLLFRSRTHVASADFDLDGDVDIVTTDPPMWGELWRNDGSWWVDATAGAFPGVTAPLEQAQGVTWADYDNDGDLDLYTVGGNRGVWDHVALEGDSLRFYIEAASEEHDSLLFTTDGDSLTLDAIRGDYGEVICWHGDGGDSTNSFPVTLALADIAGEPPDLAAGSQGLFVWSVAGAGADTVRVEVGGTGAGQLNAGGSFRANGSGIVTWSASIDPPPPYSTHDWSNRLYRNDGNGTFSEVTSVAFAVNDSTFNSKAAAWGDYDNDGWTDLYVANGGTVTSGNQPNYLYRNNGDGTFTDVASVEGVTGSPRGMSDGAAWADVNGDGFLDLFVDNGAEHPPFGVGPRELFTNAPNGNHWISLRLRGLTSNGSGIGARLRFVTASGVQWRTRLGESDNGFSSDPAIHVGLGADTVVDSIQVFWPSGDVRLYEAVAADERYVAIEGKPIRVAEDPHLEVTTPDFFDMIELGTAVQYSVQIDNFGGLAADWVARYENCGGQAIAWASIDPESSTVFPGGTSPLTLTIDTSTLDLGAYCAKTIFESNSFQGPDTLTVFIETWSPATGADVSTGLPDRFRLSSPTPNPSRGAVEFLLALPGASDAHVDVYDVRGRHVRSLLTGRRPAGVHPAHWDARDSAGQRVAAGVYFVRARAGSERETHKVVILD